MKKLIALLLVAIMCLSILAGCGGNTDDKTIAENNETTQSGVDSTDDSTEESTDAPKVEITYPLTDASDITWAVRDGLDLHADYFEVSESPFHTGLATHTGVNIDWQFVPIGSSASAWYNLLLQEETLPTIISGTNLNYVELETDGLIYDLTAYLPQYAPDYWEWLNSDEEILNSVKTIDGKILGFFNGRAEENAYDAGPFIRKDWLEECDLEIPVTLEDWETVLRAFKERYGATLSMQKGYFTTFVAMASGTGAMGGATIKFYVDENGKIQCAQLTEEWVELVHTLQRWYADDLIDPDITSVSKSKLLDKCLEDEVGLTFFDAAFSSRIPQESAMIGSTAEWIPIGYPVKEKGDEVKYSEYISKVHLDQCTVITKSASEEELITALKLLNYGYCEEGLRYWNFGTEGVTYTFDDNGEEQWTDLILNDARGKTNAVNRYSVLNSEVAPSVQLAHYAEIRYDEITQEAYAIWKENCTTAQYKVPELRYTSDEETMLSDLLTAIDTYLEPMVKKYIMGQLPFEDAYADSLEALGLSQVIEIMQTAYDRAYGN